MKKKVKLDSSQLSSSCEVGSTHKQQEEVPKNNSTNVKEGHIFEDLDPEALDYEPEAEKKSVVDQDEANKGVLSSSVDAKEDETNQHCKAKEEYEIERGEGVSGAEIDCELNATSSDKEKVDNLKEPESASLITESNRQDENNGGLNSTLGSMEDEVSKLEDKTESIASKEVDCESGEDMKNLEESTTVNEKVAREAAIKAAEESNKDLLFNFTRIPVKVSSLY